jgi:hypothetical protein
MKSRSRILVGAAVVLALAFPTIGSADDQKKAPRDAVVHFGQPQPQSTPAAVANFLAPDDVTIRKGGTVTFVVNGGGHGIAIHPVSKETTREDIAADLCQGGVDEADRLGRSAVCNGTIVTGVGTPMIIGTQNLNYDITDAKDDLIIHTGENNPASGDPTKVNPRVDDTEHTSRLLATSGRVTGDTSPPGANPAGAFLTGSAPPATPGNRIQVQFLKTGRYLVICMNRGHSLNDHMFGFVSVVGEGDDDEP